MMKLSSRFRGPNKLLPDFLLDYPRIADMGMMWRGFYHFGSPNIGCVLLVSKEGKGGVDVMTLIYPMIANIQKPVSSY